MIKTAQGGYSVIEFLVYCAIITMIIMLTMHWLVVCHTHALKLDRISMQHSALTASHDLVMRDLSYASVNKNQWKKNDEACVIWSVGEYDIGWELRHHTLFRSEGIYNQLQETWTNVRSYKVAGSVKSITIVNNLGQSTVSCYLEGQGDGASYSQQRFVAVHNGVIL